MGTVIDFIEREAVSIAAEQGIAAADAQRLAGGITKRLREEYGSGEVYIPAPSRKERNRAIVAEVRAGVPKAQIARKYGLHRKTIREIANGFGSDDWVL